MDGICIVLRHRIQTMHTAYSPIRQNLLKSSQFTFNLRLLNIRLRGAGPILRRPRQNTINNIYCQINHLNTTLIRHNPSTNIEQDTSNYNNFSNKYIINKTYDWGKPFHNIFKNILMINLSFLLINSIVNMRCFTSILIYWNEIVLHSCISSEQASETPPSLLAFTVSDSNNAVLALSLYKFSNAEILSS